MKTFYEFYKRRLGKVSDTIFDLFWTKRFTECAAYISQVVSLLGSEEELGLEDFLIFNYCRTFLEESGVNPLLLPPAPSRALLSILYDYETLEEKNPFLQAKPTPRASVLARPFIITKAILASKIGIDTGCEEVIESGTFLGASTYLFSGPFNTVDTIEADQTLFESAKGWLEQPGLSNTIRCHSGNSGVLLGSLLSQKRKKQLLFLDGHHSGGVTSNKYGECPLLDELTAIRESGVECSIVIDDARCMGKPGYPTFEEVLGFVPRHRSVSIQYDQIVIF